MAILQEWQKIAYNEKANQGELQRFWQRYFLLEKGVYEQLLTNPDEVVEGTVKELADKYGLSVLEMAGFLDGINESLVEPNPIDTMEEDTKVVEWPGEIDASRAEEAMTRAERRLRENKAETDVFRAELALKRAMTRLEVKGK